MQLSKHTLKFYTQSSHKTFSILLEFSFTEDLKTTTSLQSSIKHSALPLRTQRTLIGIFLKMILMTTLSYLVDTLFV